MWIGTAFATLVGDTVTAGHYAPDSTTALQTPSSFTVKPARRISTLFITPYPFGYRVNVEANGILVDFNTSFQRKSTLRCRISNRAVSFLLLGALQSVKL